MNVFEHFAQNETIYPGLTILPSPLCCLSCLDDDTETAIHAVLAVPPGFMSEVLPEHQLGLTGGSIVGSRISKQCSYHEAGDGDVEHV